MSYENFMRALGTIQAKRYTGELAERLTRQCFGNMEQSKNGISVEWWNAKIIPEREQEQPL